MKSNPKIYIDVKSKVIQINDGRLALYNGIKLVLLLNIMGGLTSWTKGFQMGFKPLQIIWGGGVVLSFIILVYFFYKKTAVSKIFIRNIRILKKRSFLKMEIYFLVLKNGKERTLPLGVSANEVHKLEQLIFNLESFSESR